MKLQRTFICIAGVFFAVGFAASQAAAGGDDLDGCSAGDALMEIEVNALRAGGKPIRTGSDESVDVTAKARILKGTAARDTTINTTLTIEARDGAELIGTNSTGPIRLVVGKGGKGAKLTVDTGSCTSGFITFVATFFGTDGDNDACEASTSDTGLENPSVGNLRKECR